MTVLAPVSEAAIAGVTFRASDRTQQHILQTIARLAVRHPGARLRIIQPCYNTGVARSAGTHDLDAVLDVEIDGLPGATDEARWWAAQRFLRECGWAAWFRHTGEWADRDAWHIHMISLPPGLSTNPTAADVDRAFEAIGLRVGEFVPGQVDDYFAGALGLKGQHRAGVDHSWFPPNINATVFKEDDMPPYRQWPQADKDALVTDIVNGIFNRTLGATGAKFGPLIQTIARKVGAIK